LNHIPVLLPIHERMSLTYHINPELTVEQFIQVLRDSTLAERRPVDEPDRIAAMLKNADVTITAQDGDRLVGVARAITDYSYCCYLSDLAVASDYQRQGIGRELMRRLQDYLGDNVSIYLIAAPKAREYYPYVGLTQVESAWMIPKKS
jgi:ribosomal protein S18 acetylase RimI-like enzyme